MLLRFFVHFIYINGTAVFHNHMAGTDFGEMCLKNFRSVVHGDWNNRAAGLDGNFKTAFMEWKELCFILVFVPGSLRKNADGNSGFYFVNGGEDGLQPLFDVLAVKKETVKVFHPVGQKRISLHFFFCNIAGAAGTAGIGQKYVKIASVVSDIENRNVGRNIFLSYYSDLCAGQP